MSLRYLLQKKLRLGHRDSCIYESVSDSDYLGDKGSSPVVYVSTVMSSQAFVSMEIMLEIKLHLDQTV